MPAPAVDPRSPHGSGIEGKVYTAPYRRPRPRCEVQITEAALQDGREDGIGGAGERLSAMLRSGLGGEAGEIIGVGVCVALLPALGWSLWRRLTARSDTGDRSRGAPSQT